MLGFATVACDALPRTVDEDDCRAWAEHYVAVAKVAAKDAIVACGKEAAAKPALLDRMGKSAEEETEKRRDAFLAECRGEIGKKYAPKEARCFMEGQTAKAWASCPFKINILYHQQDAQKQIEKKADLDCISFMQGSEGAPQ